LRRNLRRRARSGAVVVTTQTLAISSSSALGIRREAVAVFLADSGTLHRTEQALAGRTPLAPFAAAAKGSSAGMVPIA
jgi:hypothetical protein